MSSFYESNAFIKEHFLAIKPWLSITKQLKEVWSLKANFWFCKETQSLQIWGLRPYDIKIEFPLLFSRKKGVESFLFLQWCNKFIQDDFEKRNFYPLFLQFNFFIKLKVAKKSSNFCVNCFPSKILQVLNQKVIIFFGKQPIFSCNKFCLCCFVVCYLLSIRTWKWHFIYNFENFFIIWGGFLS